MPQVQKGFFFDMTVCVGCKTCQIACKDKNNAPIGVNFRRVHTFEGGKFPRPWIYFLSIACNHCENPRCVENCPTGACHKRAEDGLVAIDPAVCIGCRYCTWSCPYSGPQYLEEEGRTGKCDGCFDLTSQGKNPACVDACLMRALEFGDIEELKKKHPDAVELSVMPDYSLTNPNVLIKAKPEARK
ncbi:MAG TPA: DMSO/selenate family reductase complex B subunit [Symbiobacteriaceae bacterium]|nr:DMSO/selenate family reductase complex B subunit [Symbiobacteriaceae bacterium]